MATQRPARLVDRIREEIRVRCYARRVERCWLGWISRLLAAHRGRHPLELSDAELAAFLARVPGGSLAREHALSALVLLYRHVLLLEPAGLAALVERNAPRHIPDVPSPAEMLAILDRLDGWERAAALLLYGSGLRPTECLALRAGSLELVSGRVLLRGGRTRPLARAARRCLAFAAELGPDVPVFLEEPSRLPAALADRRITVHPRRLDHPIRTAALGATPPRYLTAAMLTVAFTQHLMLAGVSPRTLERDPRAPSPADLA